MFSPVVDRNGLVGQRLEALADSLCDGSISPLLTHLAQSKRLTEEQQQALSLLISELAEPAGGKAKTTKKRKR